MHSPQKFHSTMVDLLQYMGVTPPADSTGQMYTLRFSDGTPLYFWCVQEDMICIMAEAGTLPPVNDTKVLWDLLGLNGVSEGYPINIGGDRGTGKVTVWTQLDLEHANRQTIVGLIWRVLGKVSQTKQCIEGAARIKKSPARSSAVLNQGISPSIR